MTRFEYTALRPGQIIRQNSGKRMPRLVLCAPGVTQYGALTGVALAKIGHSWTDPNPTAWYDRDIILHHYDVTGRRGMSESFATMLRWWNTWHMAPEHIQRLARRRHPDLFAKMVLRLRKQAPYLLRGVIAEARE